MVSVQWHLQYEKKKNLLLVAPVILLKTILVFALHPNLQQAMGKTGYDNMFGAVKAVMKHYVNKNVVNPIDLKRRIPLILAADQGRGMNVSWQSRFKNLEKKLSQISLLSWHGWGLVLNYGHKTDIFDVQQGRDFTANQSINSPVIFSLQLDYIKNFSYVQSELNYKNMAYVAGQGEGVERRVIALHVNLTGLERHELFIDARDVPEKTDDEPPQPRPVADILLTLLVEESSSCKNFYRVEYLEGQILTHSPFKYEKDFNLGDIVTIQNKDWG